MIVCVCVVLFYAVTLSEGQKTVYTQITQIHAITFACTKVRTKKYQILETDLAGPKRLINDNNKDYGNDNDNNDGNQFYVKTTDGK